MVVTRFAPSPTGYLHLGHAFSARCGFVAARQQGGRFLLRIEDIDGGRCRREFEAALQEDLRYLGIDWDGAVRRQSEHLADYQRALARLDEMGLLYPCFCTRAEIAAEIAAAGAAPHAADGPRYPGACRALASTVAARRIAAGHSYALRLDVARALERAAAMGELTWFDRRAGRVAAAPLLLGDVVLARKEVRTSYHLAVTVDDHLQGVTLVTRGEDLFAATHLHRLLQALLQLATPEYEHHPLLTDAGGERLAKRRGAPSLRALRQAGHSPADIWRLIDLDPL